MSSATPWPASAAQEALEQLPLERTTDGAALKRFAVDGATPKEVVFAQTETHVSEALREASAQGLAVIPFGGGQQMGLGNIPSRYDIALSLERMRRPLDYEPDDLTVTSGAGVRLADLRDSLGERGQFLPIDPPGGEEMTIGGVVASAASGPLRHAFGAVRDWLIGIRVVHADGAISKAGGRVVKNVAGYEMTKLYCGSLGTLGVIAAATFKTAPLPRHERTFAIGALSADGGATVIIDLWHRGLSLIAAELLSPAAARLLTGNDGWTALVRVAGNEAAVTRSEGELRGRHADARELDAGAWERWRRAFAPRGLSMRIAALPSSVADLAATTSPDALTSVTVAAGIVRYIDEHGDASTAATMTAAAQRLNARAVIEAAPAGFKADTDVFGPARADMAIMRRLKDSFDPKGTLAPGRFAGKLGA